MTQRDNDYQNDNKWYINITIDKVMGTHNIKKQRFHIYILSVLYILYYIRIIYIVCIKYIIHLNIIFMGKYILVDSIN